MKFNKITISGGICTGKTTLYRALEKKLGWKTYSTGQFFRDYAKKHKLDLETGKEQSDEITKKIDYQVQKLLKEKKHIIVEGWLAGIMANKFPGILKVLLTCADEERVKRFACREDTSYPEASYRVHSRQQSWLKEIERIHNQKEVFNPKHYDLLIDTTELTPKQIQKRVLQTLED